MPLPHLVEATQTPPEQVPDLPSLTQDNPSVFLVAVHDCEDAGD